MTGVEGYVESASNGLVAGINMSRLIKERSLLFPKLLLRSPVQAYNRAGKQFSATNVNFGYSVSEQRIKTKRQHRYYERALEDLEKFIKILKMI